MNYTKHHDNIIKRAKNRLLEGYCERHHIIPVCMGGTNDPTNLVNLTPREHYVIHQLLIKMYPNVRGLIYAVHIMSSTLSKRNNRSYGWARKRFAEQHSKTMKGKNTGKQSKEHIEKRREALKGKPSPLRGTTQPRSSVEKRCRPRTGKALENLQKTEEHKRKISESLKGKPSHLKGSKLSTEHRLKISKSLKGKTRAAQKEVMCPHCSKYGKEAAMNRWHFNNCKLIKTVV